MSDVVAPVTAGTPAPAASTTPPPAAPAKAQAPAADEFFEVQVDGKVEKMTRAEVLRHASLAKGANKRFEESAQMRREAEAVLSQVRDPRTALKLLQDPKLGLDKAQIRSAIEDWYQENVIGPSEMTPEQLKMSEAEKRLKAYEEKEAADKIKAEEEENSKLDQTVAAQLQKEVLEQVEASGLPKTKFTASRLAYWMRVNQAKGINAPPALLVEQVRSEARGILDSMVQKSDGDVLINLLGEDTVKKIRRYDLERIRAKRGLKNPTPERDELDPPKELERIDENEVKRRMREFK